MLSIGCDIEDIERFEKKSDKFLKRLYTKTELEYCYKDKNSAKHLAVRFCAKEAVKKAMSTIYSKNIPFNKIEVLNRQNGAPYVNILIDELKKYKFHLTLSHKKNSAVAFVIVE